MLKALATSILFKPNPLCNCSSALFTLSSPSPSPNSTQYPFRSAAIAAQNSTLVNLTPMHDRLASANGMKEPGVGTCLL
jgi:hypothetical protein